jgi:hypothetical protein
MRQLIERPSGVSQQCGVLAQQLGICGDLKKYADTKQDSAYNVADIHDDQNTINSRRDSFMVRIKLQLISN